MQFATCCWSTQHFFYSPKYLQKYKYFLFMICRYEQNRDLKDFFSLLILVFILKLHLPLYLSCLKYSVCSLNGHCNHDDGQLCGGSIVVMWSHFWCFFSIWRRNGQKISARQIQSETHCAFSLWACNLWDLGSNSERTAREEIGEKVSVFIWFQAFCLLGDK